MFTGQAQTGQFEPWSTPAVASQQLNVAHGLFAKSANLRRIGSHAVYRSGWGTRAVSTSKLQLADTKGFNLQ